MKAEPRHFYEFDTFRVDIGERALLQNGATVQLTPKVFDILLALIENCGHTLTKDELMQRVWADSFVEEGNLNRNVSTLRKMLGDDPLSPRFIKTTPKRGYAFVGDVNEVWETDETVEVEQRTRYHLKVSEVVTPPRSRLWFRVAAMLTVAIVVAIAAWAWNQATDARASSNFAAADPEAVDLYNHGRALWQTRAADKLHEATGLLEQAVQKDPEFALAHAALADAYAFDYANWKKAESAAREAIRLDPNIGEPHATIGFVRMFWEWRLREAEQEFKTAIAKSPEYAPTHQWYAVLLLAIVRQDAGYAEIKRALELEPDSLAINADLCQALYLLRRHDEAVAQCQNTLALEPSFYNAHLYLYEIYNVTGTYDLAIYEFMKMEELSGSRESFDDVREFYSKGGVRAFWRARIKKLGAAHYQIAQHHARLGDKEEAIRSLHLAYEKRDPDFLLFYADPVFDDIRSDQRYEGLIGLLYPN